MLATLVLGEVAEKPCVRDPFWPVGYKTEGPATVIDEAPVVVSKMNRPVSEEDWAEARAAIPRPSGMFVGKHPKTDEPVDKMNLLGKTYYAGDQLCTTNEFIAFTWQIDSISFRLSRFELSPVSAERVKDSRK